LTPIIYTLRIIALAIMILWFIIYWQAGRGLVVNLRQKIDPSHIYHDRPLVILISLFSSLVWITGLLILRRRIPWVDTSLTATLVYPGLALTLAGTIGVSITRYQLGKYWSAVARLQPDHALVDVGAYRVVRHPLYAFAVMQAFGTCLVFPSWWNIILTVLVVICFVLKTTGEDRHILRLISGYEEYTSKVPYLLIPGIW